MKVALYARVSTMDKDQNPEVQLVQLRDYCQRAGAEIFKEYVDHASAVDYDRRTAWTQLMKDAACREFDTLLVFKFTRAFRSSIHAYNSLDQLNRYKVAFRSLKEPELDTGTLAGKIIFAVLAAIAEGEREQIAENVQAGMDYARAHGTKSGKPIGRPREDIDFVNICKAYRDGKNTFTGAAEILSRGRRPLTAGFVFSRIKRKADELGYPMKDFLKEMARPDFANPQPKNSVPANVGNG